MTDEKVIRHHQDIPAQLTLAGEPFEVGIQIFDRFLAPSIQSCISQAGKDAANDLIRGMFAAFNGALVQIMEPAEVYELMEKMKIHTDEYYQGQLND